MLRDEAEGLERIARDGDDEFPDAIRQKDRAGERSLHRRTVEANGVRGVGADPSALSKTERRVTAVV